VTDSSIHPGAAGDDPNRRDFIHIMAAATGAVGVGAVAWPFIDQMNPAADTLALASIDVDISSLSEGQELTVFWRNRPVYIRYRTAAEIDAAKAGDAETLRDKQTDEARLVAGPDGQLKPQILVLEGVCTHLGCASKGGKVGDVKGDYEGWFCPCHGSHYDTSGRIRKGPAPKNLPVPPYAYLSDTVIKIG